MDDETPDLPADLGVLALEAIRVGIPDFTLRQDMSERVLQAHAVGTYNQYVRPAEEETKRELARQSGETWRLLITEVPRYVALAGLLVMLGWRFVQHGELNLTILTLVVLVLAGPKAIEIAERALRRFGVPV